MEERIQEIVKSALNEVENIMNELEFEIRDDQEINNIGTKEIIFERETMEKTQKFRTGNPRGNTRENTV